MSQTILKLEGISKNFGNIRALSNVSLEVKKGEILAILGENGAGKSTLMKILSGLYQPDEGRILLNHNWFHSSGEGKLEETIIENPRDAMKIGLGMIYQHFQLVEPFTVGENVTLGQEFSLSPIPLYDYDTTNKVVKKLGDDFGLPIDPTVKVEELPVGLKQRVEILKQLYRDAELLILDEPTAVLTPQEVDELFKTMRNLKKAGKSQIFISHKLHEPLTIADRIVVIRGGEVVSEILPKDATKELLAELVVGRKLTDQKQREQCEAKNIILNLKNVSVIEESSGLTLLDNVNLEVKDHRIYGIAGVVGNGQRPILQSIMGLQEISSGEILFCGDEGIVKLHEMSTLDILKEGIAYIPEDRSTQGLILDFKITENMWLAYHSNRDSAEEYFDSVTDEKYEANQNTISIIRRLLFLPSQIVDKITQAVVNLFAVKTSNIHDPVRSLSGGNQQKVLLGREFSKFPRLIVASEPTRGVDIGVMRQVHESLIHMRDQGAAVLLVSSDLDEVLSLSDVILVLYEGRIVGQAPVDDLSLLEISQLMTSGEITKEEKL